MSVKFQNNRLKQLREERGLSLRELAQRVEVDFTTISKCEKGQRNFSANALSKLTTFFGCSVDYLLGTPAEDMYEKLVTSLKDFYDATPEQLSLSDEVQEPLRSKLELLFLCDTLSEESLHFLLDVARLRSAQEDFSE